MSGASSSRSGVRAPKRRHLTQVAQHLAAKEQAFEHATSTAMDAFLRFADHHTFRDRYLALQPKPVIPTTDDMTDPEAITFHLAGMPQSMSFDDFGIACGFYDAAGRHEDWFAQLVLFRCAYATSSHHAELWAANTKAGAPRFQSGKHKGTHFQNPLFRFLA
ncbi:hypothetical protein LINGRAPRIM_LOCUS624 [Linum grandiflorum]